MYGKLQIGLWEWFHTSFLQCQLVQGTFLFVEGNQQDGVLPFLIQENKQIRLGGGDSRVNSNMQLEMNKDTARILAILEIKMCSSSMQRKVQTDNTLH